MTSVSAPSLPLAALLLVLVAMVHQVRPQPVSPIGSAIGIAGTVKGVLDQRAFNSKFTKCKLAAVAAAPAASKPKVERRSFRNLKDCSQQNSAADKALKCYSPTVSPADQPLLLPVAKSIAECVAKSH